MALKERGEAKSLKSREKLGKEPARWLLLKKEQNAKQKYRDAAHFAYPFLHLR